MKIAVVEGSLQHRVHGSFSPVVNQANTDSCARYRPSYFIAIFHKTFVIGRRINISGVCVGKRFLSSGVGMAEAACRRTFRLA